jgi:hypothetical protein
MDLSIIEYIKTSFMNNEKIILKDGSELIGNIPSLGPKAFTHIIFSAATEIELGQLGKRIEIPEEYCQLLKQYNGFNLFKSSISFHGYRDRYSTRMDNYWQPYPIDTYEIDERPNDATENLFFLGTCSGAEKLIALDKTKGKIYITSRYPQTEVFREFSSIVNFLEFYVPRLESLFAIQHKNIDLCALK